MLAQIDSSAIANGSHAQFEAVLEAASHSVRCVVLQPERLDKARTRELLRQQGRHVTQLILGLLGDPAQSIAEQRDGERRNRIDAEHHQGHDPIEPDHGADEHNHHHRVANGGVDRKSTRLNSSH